MIIDMEAFAEEFRAVTTRESEWEWEWDQEVRVSTEPVGWAVIVPYKPPTFCLKASDALAMMPVHEPVHEGQGGVLLRVLARVCEERPLATHVRVSTVAGEWVRSNGEDYLVTGRHVDGVDVVGPVVQHVDALMMRMTTSQFGRLRARCRLGDALDLEGVWVEVEVTGGSPHARPWDGQATSKVIAAALASVVLLGGR